MKDTYRKAGDPTTDYAFSADCPSRPILDQIADKWSMMAMAVLERPTRFNEAPPGGRHAARPHADVASS
jgi:DNA-binding HxlR family transcriptional regulator